VKLEPFLLERFQSKWEHIVKYNLAESGVQPIALQELLGNEDKADEISELPLHYVQTNGSLPLRRKIAGLYGGADEDNVLVTNGSSEANFLAAWSLLEEGDEALVMLPNYMQIWGLVKMMGGDAIPLWLSGKDGWGLDLEVVKEKISSRTKLVALCNPNNPTGKVYGPEILRGVCEIAKDVGSWVLCDEVYRGAELDGSTSPSIWSGYDRAISSSGLSKAYGLPGLRIGWIVAQKDMINKLWAHRDYTTICTSAISDFVANFALEPTNRTRLISRTRKILATNWPILENWLGDHSDIFNCIRPDAGAISFVRYNMNLNSTMIAERLVQEKSVLVVPGDHFLMDGYIRMGYGSNAGHLETALALIAELFETF
jgi:aspartate/methionine/tyrosine aminotransferase